MKDSFTITRQRRLTHRKKLLTSGKTVYVEMMVKTDKFAVHKGQDVYFLGTEEKCLEYIQSLKI